MTKKIFMFPGVGSQKTGMGKCFHDNFPVFAKTVEEASDILSVDFRELCFSPSQKNELGRLDNSQSALLTNSVAIFRVYQQEIGEAPDFFMGHSLGEYSALCCAGVMDFSNALELVKQRGIILNEASSSLNGLMAWVINLDYKIVEKVCREAQNEGEQVFVSAFDAPFQSSISGTKDSIYSIGRKLEKEGAIVYPLKMNGPFHCPLMKPAADKIKLILNSYNYSLPVAPVIANYNALPYNHRSSSVAENLSLQLINPIRWLPSIRYVETQGAGDMLEIGANKVLKHLLKNINNSLNIYSLDNVKDLETLRAVPVFQASSLPVTNEVLNPGEITYEQLTF